MKKKVSFPHLGNYCIPLEILFENALDVEYVMPPKMTKRTLELGAMYSPDFVCSPFKYNLGNYIEAIEQGANILIQTGGSCRLDYYGELHEQILKDLGYDVVFVNMAEANYAKPYTFYNQFKKINPNLSLKKITKTLFLVLEVIKVMDEFEDYIRENVGFEVIDGSYDIIYKDFLEKVRKVKTKKDLKVLANEYEKQLKKVETNKPKRPLRVGVIGEYYTVMEPFSNHYIEKELAKKGVAITRRMNISNSFFNRGEKEMIKKIKGYVKYDIGVTGMDTIKEALDLAKEGYDGLIHVKSFGCTPEIDAMSILQNISSDYKIPILYFSFDSQTSETGIKTRLEAFYDMIQMRKERRK